MYTIKHGWPTLLKVGKQLNLISYAFSSSPYIEFYLLANTCMSMKLLFQHVTQWAKSYEKFLSFPLSWCLYITLPVKIFEILGDVMYVFGYL